MGVEAERGEDVPGGHLTAVFVATEASGLVGVELLEYAVREVGGLPRLAGRIVEEDDVVPRLVAVSILTDHPRREDGVARCGWASRKRRIRRGAHRAYPA